MAQASPCMQEAKPKLPPQPVPELSQAPSRPRPQLVQEDIQTAEPKAADSLDSPSAKPSGTPSAAATPQTVPGPPPELKQAPPRPRAATVQLPQESASSAASADEQPSPDAGPAAGPSQKLKQPWAKASAAREHPLQLEQTPVLEPYGSVPSPEEGTGTAAGLDAQPSPQATPERFPRLKGAPVRPTAQPSRTAQPAEETASIPARSDQREIAESRPQAGVEAAPPRVAPATQAQSTAESVAPEAPQQAEAALAASDAPAAAPARTPSNANWDVRRTPKAQEARNAAAKNAPEAIPPPQRPLRAKSRAAPPGMAAQPPSSVQEAGDNATASMAQSDAPKLAAPHQDDVPAGSSTSKSVSAVVTIQQNGREAAAQLAPAPAPEALPILARPAAQQPRAARGAKVRRMAGLPSPEDMARACCST